MSEMLRRFVRFEFLSGLTRKNHGRQRNARRRSNVARRSLLLADLVEPMEERIMLVGDLDVTVNDVTTIHDETSGLQNTPPNLDATTDENGNDIAFCRRLPSVLDTTGAIGAALSGYDGSNSGEDVFTITAAASTIDNLALDRCQRRSARWR